MSVGGGWELHLGPLEEQEVLLNEEPPLQTLIHVTLRAFCIKGFKPIWGG